MSHGQHLALPGESVESALNAMRTGAPLGDHPLCYFWSLRERFLAPHNLGGETAVEVAVFDYLIDAILAEYAAARAAHRLPPPDRECSRLTLEQDFRPGVEALEAWSVVYHRYVCTHHSLSFQLIVRLVSSNSRTIRRRHNTGIRWLTQKLVRAEQDARRRRNAERLQLALPVIYTPELANVNTALPTVLHFMDDSSDTPHHLVLHGPMGIGKRVLANRLAAELINLGFLDDLVWIAPDAISPDATDLLRNIASRLGIHAEDHTSTLDILRAYLYRYPTLIVLEGAEHLVQHPQHIEALLDALQPARVVITSRVRLPEHLWFYEISVPSLTQQQGLDYLEQLSQRSTPARTDWFAYFDDIWRAAGGNPLALKTVWAASHSAPFESALAESAFHQLYRSLWPELDADSRRLWLLALLFPSQAIPRRGLIALSGLPGRRVDRALRQLTASALLDSYRRENGRLHYVLEPVCAAFLLDQVQENNVVSNAETAADVFYTALEQHVDHLRAVSGMANEALHVLSVAGTLALAPASRWRLAHTLAPAVTAAGRWYAWSRVLDDLARLPLELAQARWIDVMQATARRWLGQLDAAQTHLHRAFAYYDQSAPEYLDILVERATISRYQGDWDATQRLLEQALDGYESRHDSEGVGRCIHELAQLALDAGQPDQAVTWLSRLDAWSPRNWGLISQAYLALDDLDRALETAERALEGFPPDHPNHARTLVTLGQIFDARGEPTVAIRYLLSAVNALEQCKDMLGYARAANNLAVAYLHLRESRGRQRVVPAEDTGSAASDDTLTEVRRLLVQAHDIQTHARDRLGLAVTENNLRWIETLDAREDDG